MADPSLAVKKALVTALTNTVFTNPGSPSSIVKFYDRPPQGAVKPYIAFARRFTNDESAMSTLRDRDFFYLSVWSEYQGEFEVQYIMSQVKGLLHRKRLPLETGTMLYCEVPRKWCEPDADGRTYMGQITVRVLTKH